MAKTKDKKKKKPVVEQVAPPTSDTMSEDERRSFLSGLGLNPNAAGLEAPAPTIAPVLDTAKPAKRKKKADGEAPIALAPEGVDPNSMPASEIVFDPRLLDDFPSLEGEGFAAASRYVFSLYKSKGRSERHPLLHRRIGEFISQVRRSREAPTTGYVKEKVKVSKEQSDLAALLAAKGITAADLDGLLGGER